MAGLELLGLVGTVTGIVSETMKIADNIKRWCHADSEMKTLLNSLRGGYDKFRKRLDELGNMYRDVKQDFDETSRVELKTKFQEMQAIIVATRDELRQVNESRVKKRKLGRTLDAKSQREPLLRLAEDIVTAKQTLESVFNLLSIAKLVNRGTKKQAQVVIKNQNELAKGFRSYQKQKADQAMKHQDQQCVRIVRNQNEQADRIMKRQDHNADVISKHLDRRLNEVSRKTGRTNDRFQQSSAVPPNPGHVRLNYNAQDSDGMPASFEARLKTAVLKETKGESSKYLPATTAVLGMSGTGKSCAVKGLVDDSDVEAHFRGGVYFISLGKDADTAKIVSELRKIVLLSGGEQAAKDINSCKLLHTSLYAIVEMVNVHFKGYDCLFLIDDVWKENDINQETLRHLARLARCSKKSHVVYTTTCAEIASVAETVSFTHLDPYSSEAQVILLRAANFEESDLDKRAKKATRKILRICGGLPVGLAVAGCAVRRHFISGQDAKTRNEAWTKYLRAYKAPGQMILHKNITGNSTLWKSLLASLEILKSNWKENVCLQTRLSVSGMFRSLCVLRKQQWISIDVLRKQWKLETDEEAEVVATSFEEMSLLKVNTGTVFILSYSEGSPTLTEESMFLVQMHDLVHEFACVLAEEKEGIKAWHRHLLNEIMPHDAESQKRGSRSWWECPKAMTELEGYGRKLDVVYHLKRAGLEEEGNLLCKTRRWRSIPFMCCPCQWSNILKGRESATREYQARKPNR